VKIARTQVEGAEADTVSAGERPNPQLSVSVASLSPRDGVGPGHLRDKMMDTVIGLSQTIERGDKRELRVQGAESRLEAAKKDYDATLRGQRYALRGAYYDLALAQEKQRIADDSAALYRKSEQAAQLRLRAGDISGAEQARIRVEALRAANDARQAANDLDRARLALAYLIGREGDAAKLRAVDGWPAVAPPQGAAAPDADQRPDVQAARKRVQAAEAARDLARALRTRDVNVGVQFEHNPTGSGYATNSYGVAVSVPLFLAHSYEGEIRRAEADLETAREQLDQVRGQAIADTARARSDLEAAAQRAKQYDDGLLAEAERAAKAAEFAYQHGALGLMDLLDARRTYRATQMDAATARADYAKALAAWKAVAEGKQ